MRNASAANYSADYSSFSTFPKNSTEISQSWSSSATLFLACRKFFLMAIYSAPYRLFFDPLLGGINNALKITTLLGTIFFNTLLNSRACDINSTHDALSNVWSELSYYDATYDVRRIAFLTSLFLQIALFYRLYAYFSQKQHTHNDNSDENPVAPPQYFGYQSEFFSSMTLIASAATEITNTLLVFFIFDHCSGFMNAFLKGTLVTASMLPGIYVKWNSFKQEAAPLDRINTAIYHPITQRTLKNEEKTEALVEEARKQKSLEWDQKKILLKWAFKSLVTYITAGGGVLIAYNLIRNFVTQSDHDFDGSQVGAFFGGVLLEAVAKFSAHKKIPVIPSAIDWLVTATHNTAYTIVGLSVCFYAVDQSFTQSNFMKTALLSGIILSTHRFIQKTQFHHALKALKRQGHEAISAESESDIELAVREKIHSSSHQHNAIPSSEEGNDDGNDRLTSEPGYTPPDNSNRPPSPNTPVSDHSDDTDEHSDESASSGTTSNSSSNSTSPRGANSLHGNVSLSWNAKKSGNHSSSDSDDTNEHSPPSLELI